jgi:hypothetical protein
MTIVCAIGKGETLPGAPGDPGLVDMSPGPRAALPGDLGEEGERCRLGGRANPSRSFGASAPTRFERPGARRVGRAGLWERLLGRLEERERPCPGESKPRPLAD